VSRGQAEQRLHQPEIAQAVDAAQKRIIDRAVRMHFAADDRVGFLYPLDGDEKENLLGRKIEVRVEEHDEFPARQLGAAPQRLALARVVQGERHDLVGKALRQTREFRARIVGAPVIDQDEFARPQHAQRGQRLLGIGRDARALVVKRHHHRELERGRRHGWVLA
jgi:hypothetical protein